MSFQDIFKDNFLESSANLSAVQIAMTLVVAFIVGAFIYQIYKRSYQSVVYTKSFSMSLVMMTMITALVIMAVTSNVVLSLGMVGALSIVRFRAAIKDPMDIVFMFWSIAGGLVAGAGFYTLALIGSVVIGIIILVFSGNIKEETPYLFVVHFDKEEDEEKILNKIKATVQRYFVKSKIIDGEHIEYTLELRIKNNEMAFVNEIKSIASVSNATLVSSMEFTQ
ncbi:DUF4956 domain-containing protein [Fusibacter bizertensis]|uniref:DUF4956 domain-containing protein n=1 Tax=Fusibacter bizertensis TaxID=1488331 RepID=A0ABT6NCF8_9FIRM|nr:DUF4956 domain-containing protein [Fusibacter bizertensis]MDH8678106.1 DUF4956 domain-containing protein [Fusibacter bizertensis]